MILSEKRSKPVETMRPYCKNLLRALLGQNPFQAELDELRERYDKTAERVAELNEFYFKSIEKFDKTNRQVRDYQRLIEQLRTRVFECEEQLSEYRKENNRLRGLQQAAADKGV